MTRRGVKAGSKRSPYKPKSEEQKKALKAKREEEAEVLLPMYLQPKYSWSLDWEDTDVLQKTYLCSFAGLSHTQAAKILSCPEKELLEALGNVPGVSEHWQRGTQDVVTACHLGLLARIRGTKTTETRVTTKADGGIETTTVVRELPPDTDAIKYFLSNRVVQYQESNPMELFENKVDTMLSKIEQLELFER